MFNKLVLLSSVLLFSGVVFARGGAGWPVYDSLNYQDAYFILKGKYGDVELLTSFGVSELVYLCENNGGNTNPGSASFPDGIEFITSEGIDPEDVDKKGKYTAGLTTWSNEAIAKKAFAEEYILSGNAEGEELVIACPHNPNTWTVLIDSIVPTKTNVIQAVYPVGTSLSNSDPLAYVSHQGCSITPEYNEDGTFSGGEELPLREDGTIDVELLFEVAPWRIYSNCWITIE